MGFRVARLPLVRTLMKFFAASLLSAALLSACADLPSERPVHLLGQPAPPSGATRTVVITPDTKWVNVDGGETVAFAVGDKTFGWDFFVGRTVTSFMLNQVAPPGVLDHPVAVYVAPDPMYIGEGPD